MKGKEPADYRERIFGSYLDTLSKDLEMDVLAESKTDPDNPVYVRRYLPHMPADKEARILDIGCGLGDLLIFLQDRGYRRACGIDRSPQMVEWARRRGARAVEQGDMFERLRGARGEFDCILAMDVLEHLRKDELVLLMDAVHEALRPGGCFLAHTVNADGFSWGRMRYIDLTHEIAFTRYSLSQLFTIAGFRESFYYPMEPAAPGLRGLLRTAGWKGIRLAAGLWYHVETGSGILHNSHIVTPTLLAKAVRSAGAP